MVAATRHPFGTAATANDPRRHCKYKERVVDLHKKREHSLSTAVYRDSTHIPSKWGIRYSTIELIPNAGIYQADISNTSDHLLPASHEYDSPSTVSDFQDARLQRHQEVSLERPAPFRLLVLIAGAAGVPWSARGRQDTHIGVSTIGVSTIGEDAIVKSTINAVRMLLRSIQKAWAENQIIYPSPSSNSTIKSKLASDFVARHRSTSGKIVLQQQ